MEARRRKFEAMPAFLKAGVYYTTKLECVRNLPYYPRLFAHELIVKNAHIDFARGEHESACRKYEEAYSIWRYHKSTNPKWNNEGIDDTQLVEEDFWGKNDQEKKWCLDHKIFCLLNIVACNLRSENFTDALPAVNEVLRLDPKNRIALYRRAKAVSLPVNAGVDDFKKAVKDLNTILKLELPGGRPTKAKILAIKAKLEKAIEVNSTRENKVYGKMFTRS